MEYQRIPEKLGKKRICVVGAGSSGLIAIKCCEEEKLDVVCYEMSRFYGGLWNYHEEDLDGYPSVMKSTIINTSKEMSAFSDFPPPSDFANFMHNSYMMQYFDKYVYRFGLLKNIKFRYKVVSVQKSEDYEISGRWKVTVLNLRNNEFLTEEFDGVMICSGHHIHPNMPSFSGLEDFQGKVIHTHSLKDATGFENQNVLVIGIGNSAVDAAVELSSVASQVYLSTRRRSWIFSRVGLRGMPYDIFFQKRMFEAIRKWSIFKIADTLLEFLVNLKFDHETYHLKPDHRILSAHPTINDALPNCILSGKVRVKQNVSAFTKRGVIFENESEETKIAAVVMATGYQIKLPFLEEDTVKVVNNNLELYKMVFPSHLPHPSLAFIAFVQPLGAIFPIAEAQSRWYAQLMKQNLKLPSQNEMVKEIRNRSETLQKQYVCSPRHTVQVFWIEYMDEICSEFGAKPPLWKLAFTDPKLFWACITGPCLPYQYRLYGPCAWPGARDAILSVYDRIAKPFQTYKAQ